MRSFGNNKFSSENICKQDQRVFVVPQRLYNLFWIDSMCLQKKKSPLKQTSDKTNSTSAAALCLVLHLLFHVENPFFLIFPHHIFSRLIVCRGRETEEGSYQSSSFPKSPQVPKSVLDQPLRYEICTDQSKQSNKI